MALTANDIIRILEKASELGLIEKIGHKENGQDDSAGEPADHNPDPEKIFMPASPLDDLTDEEILYWATPYYDELQARKEDKKRRIEEERSLEEHG